LYLRKLALVLLDQAGLALVLLDQAGSAVQAPEVEPVQE